MLEIQYRKVEELIPYARNSRTHSDAQVAQIAASIKEFGWTNPVLVDGENGIIAGHGRLLAARKLGQDEVPTIELAGLSDAQKRAYIIADNKLALNAGWDDELLALELGELQELGFDIELTGFSADELADLEPEELPPSEKDEQIPELPADPVSKPGDVWILGRHRLMCGDSTSIDAFEQLMAGAKADFCFTSPPYNSAMKGGGRLGANEGKGFYGDGYKDDRSSDDYVQFNQDIITALEVVAADNFTLCYNINYNKNSPSEYIDVVAAGKKIVPLVETIVWEKHLAVSLQGDNLTRIFEFIFVFAKGKFKINKNRTECLKNLWKISNIGANHDIHKACFPVALVEEGIKNFCPHGGKVVEPFGGSGTTMIAAEKLGCTSYLMELDPKYCDVIVKRWQDFTGKQATLESDGSTFDSLVVA